MPESQEKTKYEIQQLSEWWFDISKLALGSIIPVIISGLASHWKILTILIAWMIFSFALYAGRGFAHQVTTKPAN